jgi:hypothetical protein
MSKSRYFADIFQPEQKADMQKADGQKADMSKSRQSKKPICQKADILPLLSLLRERGKNADMQ